MSSIAIFLVIVSATLHVGWNLLSKKKHPSASFFLLSSFIGFVLLSPSLIIYHDILINNISLHVWILLITTGFFMAMYYICLATAYRHGDISIAYPLARSIPVIIVMIVTLTLGYNNQITLSYIIGIFLVVGGCFFIPLRHFKEMRFASYLNPTCTFALLAAIGTAGYSIIDDIALRLLRTSPQITINNMVLSMLYACLQALIASLWLAFFVLSHHNGRSSLWHVLKKNKKDTILSGMMIQISYTIILISLAFANNVSYIVGFRQIGIPLGAIAGIVILKEFLYKPKISGIIIMCIGLIFLAIE